MAAGLAQAWSFTANQGLDAVAACRVLGGLAEADASAVAAALTHLGRLDQQIAKANRNKSLSWDFLTAAPAALAGFTAGVSPTELTRSLAYLEESASLVAAIQDNRVQAELSVGLELARAGLRRAAGQPLTTEAARELRERFERTWLARARRGGLAESVAGLGLA